MFKDPPSSATEDGKKPLTLPPMSAAGISPRLPAYDLDTSVLRPLFAHFDDASRLAAQPYRMLFFPGNHSDLVYRIARIRGYTKVLTMSRKASVAGLEAGEGSGRGGFHLEADAVFQQSILSISQVAYRSSTQGSTVRTPCDPSNTTSSLTTWNS